MQQIVSRLSKVEEENARLIKENNDCRKELEEVNLNLKDEFDRFTRELKNLTSTIQKQNETIVSLSARIGAAETNQVTFLIKLATFCM